MFLIAPCSIIAFQYFLRYYDQGKELLRTLWKKYVLSVDIVRCWIGSISFHRPFNSYYWIDYSKEINWKNGCSSNFLCSKKHFNFRKIDYCHDVINELRSLLCYSSLTHSFVVQRKHNDSEINPSIYNTKSHDIVRVEMRFIGCFHSRWFFPFFLVLYTLFWLQLE